MMAGRGFSRALLLCLSGLWLAGCGRSEDPTVRALEFGERIEARYAVPQTQLDAWNKSRVVKTAQGDQAESREIGMPEALLLPTQAARQAHNPYRLVIVLRASAVQDGVASSMWNAQWQVNDGPSGPIANRLGPSMSQHKAKAGEAFTLIKATPPIHVTRDLNTLPELYLFRMENMALQSVQVLVVSGMEPNSWLDWSRLWVPLLLGVILVVLWRFWLRPQAPSGT